MSQHVRLVLRTDCGDGEEVVEADFEEQEWRILQAFITYIDELRAAKFAQTGIPFTLRINTDAKTGQLEVETELPPWDDVIVLLHKLRPFVLENEQASFYRVSSLLGKHIQNPLIHNFLRQSRDFFEGKSFQEKVKITVNEHMLLNSEKALKIWLNAYEYHRVMELQEELGHLTYMITLDGAKAIFLALLNEKLEALSMVSVLIRNVLGDVGTVSVQLHPKYLATL